MVGKYIAYSGLYSGYLNDDIEHEITFSRSTTMYNVNLILQKVLGCLPCFTLTPFASKILKEN